LNPSGQDYSTPSQDMKNSYHLEIDAETGRQGLADENIKIYQVDAPDRVKKRNQRNIENNQKSQPTIQQAPPR